MTEQELEIEKNAIDLAKFFINLVFKILFLISFLFVIFNGNPDLHDAIIRYLMKGL